jgi:hypothetical protein
MTRRVRRRAKKQGQMMGQVFVLILAALIFILILVYGYRAIGTFIQRSDEVALIQFETDLGSAIKQISLDFGSVKKVELTVPKGVREVCFVSNPSPLFSNEHPLLSDAFSSGTQNVFLLPLQETAIFVENFEAVGGASCLSVRDSRIVLRLEGLGNRAKVSAWS